MPENEFLEKESGKKEKTNLKKIMLILFLIAFLGLCGFILYFFAIQDWDNPIPDKEYLGT